MKILKLMVSGLDIFKEKIELDFYTEQNVISDNSDMVHNTFGKIFTNNVVSIVGINASGKTSLLKLIAFSIDFLNGIPLNNIDTRDILMNCSNINFEIVFFDDNNNICKLISEITLSKTNAFETKYFISNETLYKKKVSKVRTKKDLLLFDTSNEVIVRDNNEEFLKDDISIVISINKNEGFNLRNLIEYTNFNLLQFKNGFPKELIQFLDPTLKNITYNVYNNDFKIEFFNKEPISVSNQSQLEKYLSSGTIKGINIFLNAMYVFERGGYLIVDELENHFNREIVLTLIRFFMNKNINTLGATLIFSTHYPELLDEFERNDNIYIVRNQAGIVVQKLYRILKRNDIKKSEAFKSGYLGGTVPSYKSYLNLKHAMIHKEKMEA